MTISLQPKGQRGKTKRLLKVQHQTCPRCKVLIHCVGNSQEVIYPIPKLVWLRDSWKVQNRPMDRELCWYGLGNLSNTPLIKLYTVVCWLRKTTLYGVYHQFITNQWPWPRFQGHGQTHLRFVPREHVHAITNQYKVFWECFHTGHWPWPRVQGHTRYLSNFFEIVVLKIMCMQYDRNKNNSCTIIMLKRLIEISRSPKFKATPGYFQGSRSQNSSNCGSQKCSYVLLPGKFL